jgi:PKD repeat protein
MKTRSLLAAITGLFFLVACGPDDKDDPKTDANFSISGYETPLPATITFINTSTNATTYSWDFGDGTTSTMSNPTHTYTLAGTYILRLKATGPNGADSVCKLVSLDAVTQPSKSYMSYFFDRCTGAPVGASFKTLNPASTNTVWDFGDGVININRDPIVQFLLPGDYTIKYSSLINGVRDTLTRIIQIH